MATLLFFLVALACSLACTTALFNPVDSLAAANTTLLTYPTPSSLPSTVYRVNYDNRTQDAQLTLFTLQGCLARQALNATAASFPLLYKTTGTANRSSDGTWTYWRYYQDKYGGRVAFDERWADGSVEDIVGALRPYVAGYYLASYAVRGEADNVNMAINMAATTNATIVATEAYAPLMKQLGIPLLRDMRGYTEASFLYQYQPLNKSATAPHWPFNAQYISAQTPTKAATFLTDWSMLASAVTLHHTPTATAVLKQVPAGRPFAWLGWTVDTQGENDMTSLVSAAGGLVWAADTQNNLGTHAFFRDALSLNGVAIDTDMNKGKHTVAFLFTDGDSLVADTDAVVDAKHWFDPRRGSFAMSFGVDPSLAYLAPSTLGIMYDTAGPDDGLVAFAPGYAYPSYMSEEQVWAWAEGADATMAAAGLYTNYYIDFNYSAAYFGPLLQQPHVGGVVYFDYPNYYVLDGGRNGTVTWVNSKPAIAVRDSLWTGHSTPQSIADVLNRQLRDNTQTGGYSVIAAHLWSQDVSTIADCVARLDKEGVVVVTVDVLMALMAANVGEADRVVAQAPVRPSRRSPTKQQTALATE